MIPDRLDKLLSQTQVTGIDFVTVDDTQKNLEVHFYTQTPPATVTLKAQAILGALGIPDIRIYNPSGTGAAIKIKTVNWDSDNVLKIVVENSGDFSLYKLQIVGKEDKVDPFYNNISFSFKINCKTDLDCKPPVHECPDDPGTDFPIDYMARDFWSFRKALLDFASQRYPQWEERHEADLGIMLTEMMSAAGDEIAYYQDRIAREAYLETATQRRSLRRHARLVDYHIQDNKGASSWLDVTVRTGMSGSIPAGTDVWAISDDGTKINYEVGHKLDEITQSKSYPVDERRNEYIAHVWDEDELCLPVGTTEIYIEGDHTNELLPFDDLPEDKVPGRWVLIKTDPRGDADPDNDAHPARAHMVRLISITKANDPVLGKKLTHLIWEKEQALPFEFDLIITRIRANMIPVTSGKTYITYFITGEDFNQFSMIEQQALRNAEMEPANQEIQRAVERKGHDNTLVYLITLPESDKAGMVYLGDDADETAAEILLRELNFSGGVWTPKNTDEDKWVWRRSLVGIYTSTPEYQDYTSDDGSWRRTVSYRLNNGEEFIHRDYASNDGFTIRFGDGEFGKVPPPKTVFRADYRLGNGENDNVAPGSLQYIENTVAAFVKAVSNPLRTIDAKNIETPEEIRQQAPEAFRALTFRAVREEDYAEAAERLLWVQRAGADFRWTGSWLSAFVTPDPRDAIVIDDIQRTELINQQNRFRQAGREVYVSDPEYANLDIEIDVCAKPDVYAEELKQRILYALLGKKGLHAFRGYFSPDNFTFGDHLERSTLEAAIQEIPGVRAVERIQIGRRGWFKLKEFTDLSYDPGKNSIINVENDPSYPENGTLKIKIHGAA